MHILSPETDNCPSWISGRERMTVENISWSISTKECCRPRWGLNPRPPGLQSDGASNWATKAGIDPHDRHTWWSGVRSARRAARQLLMWMLPLYLHVNQKSDYNIWWYDIWYMMTKCEKLLHCKSYLHFFSKKLSAYLRITWCKF